MLNYTGMIKDLRLIIFLGSLFLVVISCVLESVIGFYVIFITPPLLFFWLPIVFKSQKLINEWKEEKRRERNRLINEKLYSDLRK